MEGTNSPEEDEPRPDFVIRVNSWRAPQRPPRKTVVSNMAPPNIARTSSTEDDESALFPQLLQAMGRVSLMGPATPSSPGSPPLHSSWSTPQSPVASIYEDGNPDAGSSQDHSSSHSEFISGSES